MKISEFQDLMEDLYGDCDRERGMPSSVAWLCEEVGELAQAVRKGTREEQLHELGDVLAWLSSIANQLDLSLTDAAQRYVDLANEEGVDQAQVEADEAKADAGSV